MNHILKWYLPFLMKNPFFLSILDTFWPIFGHFSYSTSINHSLTIELNTILNWITRVYFELNNILNWILGKAILNRLLNESFFGKIQTLNWIRLGITHHYPRVRCAFCDVYNYRLITWIISHVNSAQVRNLPPGFCSWLEIAKSS